MGRIITTSKLNYRFLTPFFKGTLFLYTGNSLLMFFDSEKPAIKQQIQAEFDKNAGQRPAAPIRGPAAKQRAGDDGQIDDNGNADNGGGGDYEEEATQAVNLKDLIPRVDISSHITEAFLAEMADKNWKTRNEGLTKLQGTVTVDLDYVIVNVSIHL